MDIFGSSGTRGLANQELTPEFVTRVAASAATVWGADRAAVARDTRTTGGLLADAAAAGLAGAGADVERLGVLPTPGAQAYAEREGVPAVVVTASHNPPQDNGVKLVGADGAEADADAYGAVDDTYREERFERAAWDQVGDRRRVEDAREDYVEEVIAAAPGETIADAGLRIALDPGHGAGSLTSPEIFRELGCEVVTVNAQPDGHFPGRDPEPVPGHLGDLRRLVRTADADLGIAHDGDADRAVFVDETGATIGGSTSFAALAASALGEGDTLVSAINVSQRVVDAVERAGATLDLTPVGSTNIFSRVRELRPETPVPVAGEGNGGVAFPDYRLARDGAYTAARFLALVAERPASEIAADHAGYQMERINVDHDGADERAAVLSAVERAAREAAEEAGVSLTTTDGYRLDYGDAWALVRPSGTESVVRVVAEARDEDRARELVEWLAGVARDARDTHAGGSQDTGDVRS